MLDNKNLNIIFQKQGILLFIQELKQDPEFKRTFTDNILEEQLKTKNADIIPLFSDLDELYNRVMEYFKFMVNKFEDYDEIRITENRKNELRQFVEKIITKDKITEKSVQITTPKEYSLRLSKLQLKNWLLFPDQEVDFNLNANSKQPRSNIILFIGENSVGKTAIFQALKIALIGPEKYFKLQGITQKKQIDEKFKEMLNKAALQRAYSEKQDTITMEIRLSFQIFHSDQENIKEYTIVRIWHYKVDGNINDPQLTMYNSEFQFETLDAFGSIKSFEEEYYTNYIEKYLPEFLINLIISDKTHLLKSLLDEKAQYIRQNSLIASDYNRFTFLKSLLKNVFDLIEEDLQKWLLDHISSNKEELEQLINRNKEIEKKTITITKKIPEIMQEIESNNKEIEDLRLEIKDFKSEKYDEYVELDKAYDQLERDRLAIFSQISNLVNNIYVKSILNNIVNFSTLQDTLSIQQRNLNAVPEQTIFDKYTDYYSILEVCLEHGSCICDQPLNEKIREKFEQQTHRQDIASYHQMMKKLQEELDSFQNSYQEEKGNIQQLRQKYPEIIAEKEKLDKKKRLLNSYSFSRDARAKLIKIESKRKENETVLLKKDELEKESESLNQEKTSNLNQIEELQKIIQDPIILQEQQKFLAQKRFCEYCLITLELLMEKYEDQLRFAIEILLTDYFQTLDWEHEFWQGFHLNSNWELEFIDKTNQKIYYPSDGQKKIIMISFICIILNLRPYRLPWIVDNVLSEISDLNIEGFAKQLQNNTRFPQQILFLTKTEWENIAPYIKSFVDHPFVFQKKSAIESIVLLQQEDQ